MDAFRYDSTRSSHHAIVSEKSGHPTLPLCGLLKYNNRSIL